MRDTVDDFYAEAVAKMGHNSHMSRNDEFYGASGAKTQAQQDQQDFHASLVPMKETIRNQGASFSSVAGHLHKASKALFGTKMGRKDILRWAAKKHSEDPDNFLKNIGFTK